MLCMCRYQSEVTSPRDVCLWAGFPISRCMLPYTTRHPINSSSNHLGNKVSTNATSEPDTQYYSYSAYSANAVVNTDTQKDTQVVSSSMRRLTDISHSSDALPHQSNVSSPNAHSNNTTQIFASSVRAITWSDLDKEDLALANEVPVSFAVILLIITYFMLQIQSSCTIYMYYLLIWCM